MKKLLLYLAPLVFLAPASAQTPRVLDSLNMEMDLIAPTPQMNQFVNRYAKSFSNKGCQGGTIGFVLTAPTPLNLNVDDLYNDFSATAQKDSDFNLRDIAVDKANNVLVTVAREEGTDVMILMQPKGKRLLIIGCEL